MNKQAGTPNVTNTSHNVTSQNFSFFFRNQWHDDLHQCSTYHKFIIIIILIIFTIQPNKLSKTCNDIQNLITFFRTYLLFVLFFTNKNVRMFTPF